MRCLSIFLACLLLAACGPRDTRSDLEKLAGFHRQMIAVDHLVAAASATYTRSSGAALDRGDGKALLTAARNFSGTLSAILPRAQALAVPHFDSGAAGTSAARAQAALIAAIRARREAAHGVEAMADPIHPMAEEVAALSAAQDISNSADVAESSSVVAAYGALGVTPDRIDMRAGGVRR